MPIRNVLLLVLAAGSAFAADPAYAGKWKMNPAKSDLAGTTMALASFPSGEWQSTSAGQTYTFRMDGKEYPDGFGGTAAWKAVDATTWQTAWKVNGKALETNTLKLSADGSNLTIVSKGVKQNGDPMDETDVFQRVSGGPGLAGKWKTATVKTSTPSEMELVPLGTDGLRYRSLSMGHQCDSKLDGKDYPCTGPMLPAGWTAAVTKAGDRSLDLTIKKDGKPFAKWSYTVAGDGKTPDRSRRRHRHQREDQNRV